MKVYVLIAKDKHNQLTFEMPKSFGRQVRAYSSKGHAKAYAKKFGASVYEFESEKGTIIQ